MARTNEQIPEDVKKNRFLIDKILSCLGEGHCVTLGRRIEPTDGDYLRANTYKIKKTGLNGSKRWIFGAKTILQLCGMSNESSAPFGAFDLRIENPFTDDEKWYIGSGCGEPTELSNYVVHNKELIPKPVRSILLETGLPEYGRHSFGGVNSFKN